MLTRDDPILIVDDDNLVRLGLQMTLEDQGYRHLHTAKTGMAAIDMAVRYRPKLILMDVRLKGDLDGVEAAQSIRQKYSCQIIFLTGSNEAATRLRIEAAAPDGVLVKPILPQHLIGALEALPG
ncbi:response regulator [Skermanella pratensis]|uniref:response regulator n=1 Tax=Skermanella pratensis TaxID=2233999 RepID=UPI00130124BE|nr:response regulator [Skermanella pratensis]